MRQKFREGVRFRCGSGGTAGHAMPGSNEITLGFRGTSADDYLLQTRAFHELLHAIDDDAAMTPHSHEHRPGFPDPVYSCQYACFGGFGDTRDRFHNNQGSRIPASRKLKCHANDDDSDCQLRAKYAYVCETGKYPVKYLTEKKKPP